MNSFQIFACIVILLVIVFGIFKYLFRNYGVPCPQCADFNLDLQTDPMEDEDVVFPDNFEESDIEEEEETAPEDVVGPLGKQ